MTGVLRNHSHGETRENAARRQRLEWGSGQPSKAKGTSKPAEDKRQGRIPLPGSQGVARDTWFKLPASRTEREGVFLSHWFAVLCETALGNSRTTSELGFSSSCPPLCCTPPAVPAPSNSWQMLPLHQERAAGNPQPVVWLGRPLCLSVTGQAQLPKAHVPILLLLSSMPPCPGHRPCSPCQQPGPAGGGGAGRVWKFPSLWADSMLFRPPSYSQPFQNNTFQFLPNILLTSEKTPYSLNTVPLSHTQRHVPRGSGARTQIWAHTPPCTESGHSHPMMETLLWVKAFCQIHFPQNEWTIPEKVPQFSLEGDLGWPNPPVYQACQGMVAPDGEH